VSVRIGLAFGPFPFSGPRAFWRWVDACEDSEIDSIFLPATIDLLSDGRFLPMFGVGEDFDPEWAAMGLSPRNRGAKTNEMIEIITSLWARDHVDYAGKHYQLRDVTVAPKPKQSPLPLWIGGRSEAAIERTARYGYGWIGGSTSVPEEIGRIVVAIRTRATELGRTIEDDHYGAGFNFRFGMWSEPIVERVIEANRTRMGSTNPSRYLAVGDAEAILGRITAFREQGISKFVLRPIAASDDEMVEQSLRLSREVIPLAQEMG